MTESNERKLIRPDNSAFSNSNPNFLNSTGLEKLPVKHP